MKSGAEARGRLHLLSQQLKEVSMASQEVGDNGADNEAQYARCILIHPLRHAEEQT